MINAHLEEALGRSLADYSALNYLSWGTTGDQLLGRALDAAAAVVASQIAALTGDAELIHELQIALEKTKGRFSKIRASFALAPILSLLENEAALDEIARALKDALSKCEVDELPHPQPFEVAKADMQLLLSVTGDGGNRGEVLNAAREAGLSVLERARQARK